MLTHTLIININGPDLDPATHSDEEMEVIFEKGEEIANDIEETIRQLYVLEGAQFYNKDYPVTIRHE